MSKTLTLVIGLCLLVASAMADSYTYTTTCTNNKAIAYSDPLPISGYIERIEVYQSSSVATTTVTVATYDGGGTTALTTFASKACVGNQVFTPRVVGSTTAGVTLVAATGSSSGTNTTTMLVVPYEKMMIGGNTKVAVTGGDAPLTAYTINVTVFYTPIKR
jgi:hypothetical protein